MRGTLDTSQILNLPHRYSHYNILPTLPTSPPFMKILESQSAVLSNYEVLAHLTANRAKPRTAPQKHSNVKTVLKEVPSPSPSAMNTTLTRSPQLTDYLSPPPASRSRIPRYQTPPYSDAALRALVTGLQPYKLTKSEVLMIVNLRPENLGLLDCVVEECDERFSSEQQDEIVKIIGDVLGREVEGGVHGGEANALATSGVNGEVAIEDGMNEVNGEGAYEDGPM